MWSGYLGMPGLFDGTHMLSIERGPTRNTRFIQEEHFSGRFVPFVGFDPNRDAWEKMNEALKTHAEK